MAWENDKLGRSTCAEFLTNYLTKLYSNGDVRHFVLAIDAEWGEGKTFLLENWKEDLIDQGYPAVYFNAWENDFSDDPLVAIITDLNDQLESYYEKLPEAKKAARSLMRIAPGIIKSGFKLVGVAAAKKIFGMGLEELNELWEHENDKSSSHENKAHVKVDLKSIEQTADKLSELVFKEHTAKKLSIKDFRENLTTLVETLSSEQLNFKLPLFVFIDELDRCRPNYAIELLESIKHLFGVPGIYFVVATNMKQLSYSIGVLYGSNFESERYLKRFFDQEYIIPNPDRLRFIEFLFEKYAVLRNVSQENIYSVLTHDCYQAESVNIHAFNVLSQGFKLTLRDQEQVAAVTRAIMLTWSKRRLHFFYLLFCVMLRHKNKEIFNKVHNRSLKRDDLSEVIMEKISVKFRAVNNHIHYGSSVEAISLINLVWHYYTIAEKDLNDISNQQHNTIKLPDAILAALAEEMPRQYRSGDRFPSGLLDYSHLVAQAGQLIV